MPGLLDWEPLEPLAPLAQEVEVAAAPGKLLDVAERLLKLKLWPEFRVEHLSRAADAEGRCVYRARIVPRSYWALLEVKLQLSGVFGGVGYVGDKGEMPQPHVPYVEVFDHPELRLGYGKPMYVPGRGAPLVRELIGALG